MCATAKPRKKSAFKTAVKTLLKTPLKTARRKSTAASAQAAASPSESTSAGTRGSARKALAFEPFDWLSVRPAPIIGVDEVGRGCLAGPVFAAAVILPAGLLIPGITDSKLLSETRREALAEWIHDHASVGIGFASVGEIDRLNILQASFLAMQRAIENLAVGPGHVLVDGHQQIPRLEGFRQTAVIKGDLRALPIGAASIVAKVARDTLMKKLGEKYAVYGFEKHKGYASSLHLEAIQKHGPCVHHRSTFAGVREHWTDLLDEERARDPF
jgi:ribonuclease HII